MYRPLDPYVREFIIATLVACIRFDCRTTQANRYLRTDTRTLLRTDLIVDNLAVCLGASLENSRVQAVDYYKLVVRFTVGLLENPLGSYQSTREFDVDATLNAELKQADQLSQRRDREAAYYIACASGFLRAIEGLVHNEHRGTLTERAKRRITDRLKEAKQDAGDDEAEPIPAPPHLEPQPAPQQAAPQQAAPQPQVDDEDTENDPIDAVPNVRQPIQPTLRQRLARRISRTTIRQLPMLDDDVDPEPPHPNPA